MKTIKDEEEQVKLAELMGNSLLSEEVHFVGFLPLRTYIEDKKSISTGVKCPPEKEAIVRALILKDQLEELNCTLEILKSQKPEPQLISPAKEESKLSEEIFALIDNSDLALPIKIEEKPLIIVDA